jgi:SAM-dependent methyltransferase
VADPILAAATGAAEPSAERRALARLYDIDLLEDPGDEDLYLALARRTGGPILELGVGTGRLATALAAAGHDVTGVDLDEAMLERARRAAVDIGSARFDLPAASSDAAGVAASADDKAAPSAPPTASRGSSPRPHVSFVVGDMVDVRLGAAGSFRLAFIALNTLFVLATRDRQRAAIATLAAHLAPGGLAVVDIWLPDTDDLARFDGRLIFEYERVDPESGRTVSKVAAARHDPALGMVDLTSIYEEGAPGEPAVRWIRHDALRLVGPDELRSLAGDAGLVVEQIAGTYDLDPLGPGSERAILIARRP